MTTTYSLSERSASAHKLLQSVLPSGVDSESVAAMAATATWFRTERSKLLVREHAQPLVWLLERGSAWAYSVGPAGNRFGFRIYRARDAIGMAGVWNASRTSLDVRFGPQTVALQVEAAVLRIVAQRDAVVLAWITDQVAADYGAAQCQMAQAQRPARDRVVCVLLQIAHTARDGLRSVDISPLTRLQIAELAGITKDSAIRILQGLEAESLVENGYRRIRILEPRQFEAIVGCDYCPFAGTWEPLSDSSLIVQSSTG